MDDELIDSLQAVPLWKTVPLDLPNSCLMINSNFVQKELTYNINAFDGSHFWQESVTKKDFLKKCKELNPKIEANLDYIFNEIKTKCDELSCKEKFNVYKEQDDTALRILLKFKLSQEVPFSWRFDLAKMSNNSLIAQNMLLSLFSIIGELSKRQNELFSIIEKKDVEIQDMKDQGATPSRRNLETELFVSSTFLQQRFQSEEFSEVVANPIKAFTDEHCQKLFGKVVLRRQDGKMSSHDRVKEQDTDQEVTSNTSTQMTSLADEEGSTSTCLHQNSGTAFNVAGGKRIIGKQQQQQKT
ncbi:non-homologous end-joining factor 1-like isoform X3 [Rhopilema esculentum]|uniref:non-homologous end-joining factor 1-like isoform X3 n=1 Tax=Rhopilema esculentum TaxID=499914 RepID=UPI0031D78067